MRMLMHRAVARVAAVAARRPRAAALMILAACGRFTDARIAVSAQADGTEQHHNCYRCHSESAHVLLPICLAPLGCARRRLLSSLRLVPAKRPSAARTAGFHRRTDSSNKLSAACPHRNRARRSEPCEMMLEDLLQLVGQALDLEFLGHLRPLLAILQPSSPASVKFLEAQLGFGEGRLVLEVQTPQRIVQLGDRAEAAPQYPPLHQRREHYTEHQD